jgi:tetratricopeptide (TPR) repeat protein
MLHVTHGGDRVSILFVGGAVVHGAATLKECHLGECLMRHGRLSEEGFRRASEVVGQTGRRLGEVLVETGLLDQDGLEDALALHVREILLTAFSWSEGRYSFEEQDPAALRGYDKPLRLSTGEVILDAVWSVTDSDVVRYALGDLDRPVALSTDPLLRFQRVTLTPTDGYLLSRVDGTTTAREVLAIAPVPGEEAERSLFGLLSIGMVEYRPAPPRPRGPAPPPTEATREEIVGLHRRLATLDHFEVLGLTPEATEAEVEAAYLRLARRFHPDIQHREGLGDLRSEVEAIFSRLGQAHHVLSEPGSRARYEGSLLVRQIGPAPDGDSGVPGNAVVPPPGPVRTPEEAIAEAEEAYGAGRYWDALQMLEAALPETKGRLRQRARVLLAQCCLKNPKWRKRAEEELIEAIREEAANAEAYFVLGTIYRDAGLAGRASAMFRKTLALKPRHARAASELAVLPKGTAPEKGLLKKLIR